MMMMMMMIGTDSVYYFCSVPCLSQSISTGLGKLHGHVHLPPSAQKLAANSNIPKAIEFLFGALSQGWLRPIAVFFVVPSLKLTVRP